MKRRRRRLTSAVAVLICSAGTTAAITAAQSPSPVAHEVNLVADALIMTGTNMPIVDQAWMQMAMRNYIRPTLGDGYTAIPVATPEQFWPFTGFDDLKFDLSVLEGRSVIDAAITDSLARADESDAPTVVFGYSQSSVIASLEKRHLADSTAGETTPPAVSFVMLANPNRPNGGINARFDGLVLEKLGWTFWGAAPTDTPFQTIDVARQYDLFADFPTYPLNVVASANAAVALFYGAHDYTAVTLNPDDPAYDPNTVVQKWGDTTYYFIPATQLPLLRPLRDAGMDPVLVDAAEPAVRVLVEAGYDRSTSFGQPTPAQPGVVKDVDQFRSDFAAAIKQGEEIIKTAKVAPAVTPAGVKPAATRPARSTARGNQSPAPRPVAAAASRSRR